jgi:hypothetical protein
MPAKDSLHNFVIEALKNDGWMITHDPYFIKALGVEFHIDLGAEKVIAAEKNSEKIAVEVKTFAGQSFIYDFHSALGQYENYRIALEIKDPARKVFLAVADFVFDVNFQKEFIQQVIKKLKISIIVVDTDNNCIRSWIR